MPRASPSAKRQPAAASQRDLRHENGPAAAAAAASGRRLAKHRTAPGASSADGAVTAGAGRTGGGIASAVSAVSPASKASKAASSSSRPCPTPSAVSAVGLAGYTAAMGPSQQHPQQHRGSDAAGRARRSTADRRSSLDDVESSAPGAGDVAGYAAGVDTAHVLASSASAGLEDGLNHRRIDVNAAKNLAVHRDPGPVDFALTVLRSCPLYDTIAILIILMQLSPIALSSIYMLFTVLTFVPPVTTSSGLSITEFFEGTLGTPALTTVVCMDVGFLLVWLFLWGPLQLLILDFAQVVIALTLGGGHGGRRSSGHGSANNIFVCMGIVLFSHFGHIPSLQQIPHLGPLLAADQSTTATAAAAAAGAAAGRPASFQPAARLFARHGGASWVRNIFAIHILTQGVVRYIREWYLRREQRDNMAHAANIDPEAARTVFAPADTPVDASFGIADASDGAAFAGLSDGSTSHPSASSTSHNHTASGGAAASTAAGGSASGPGTGAGATGNPLAPPGGSVVASSIAAASNAAGGAPSSASLGHPLLGSSTSTNTNTTTNTGSNPANSFQPVTGYVSSKKKRKQNTLVRARQPLWAALASTKIVMIKEYELSQAASESAGAEATDVDNLGNAPFFAQPGQIWICFVGHDEVCFATSVFPDDGGAKDARLPPNSSYIDVTKPFYVRINNATWQPTRIIPVAGGGDGDDDTTAGSGATTAAGRRWTGDIYGLTPLSSYECEFISTRTGEVLFSTSVRTAPAPSTSTDVAAAKPAAPSQLRPHESPATTIKASIATQEAKLNDEKTRLKTLRKDNNRRINALKKEIDRLASSVQSAGGNDEKLRQKINQNNVQQKQAEQAIESLDAELQDVSTVPDDLLSQHRAKKSEWDREKAQFDGAVASFKSFKTSVDSELRTLEEEQSTLQSRRNKIAARIAKADSDHARIMDANARGLDEAERRRQQRADIEVESARMAQNYTERIAAVQSSNAQKVQAIETMHETMHAFYSSFDSERPYDDRFGSVAPPLVPSATTVPTPAASGPWSGHAVPPTTTGLYAPGAAMWPALAGVVVPTTGPSPIPSSLAPAATYMPMAQMQPGFPAMLPRTRGRSSSMLSDVSGFTQSSNGDDDAFMPPSVSGPAVAATAAAAAAAATGVTIERPVSQGIAIRSPLATGSRSRDDSSSNSAAGSASSGSASASPREAASTL